MKKKIKTIVFILLSIWVVLGIVARMDLRYLADKYHSVGLKSGLFLLVGPKMFGEELLILVEEQTLYAHI